VRDADSRIRRVWTVLAVATALVLGAAVYVGLRRARTDARTCAIVDPPDVRVPRPAHVLIVIEENRAYRQIIDAPTAPYISSLAREGANFTSSFAETHPSRGNYLALFSGSTHGVTDEDGPLSFSGPNLGRQLLDAGLSFGGYSESMPSIGFTGAFAGRYKRQHNPWVDFEDLPTAVNMRLDDLPSDFDKLPTVAIIVPNYDDDMHRGSIETADAWLRIHVEPYVKWATTHDSLFILTFDEDDDSPENRIPTLFVGPMVRPGNYDRRIDHYCVLRTIEAMYGLAGIGHACDARTIGEIWAGSDGR
jgi:acid phosphatase